MTTRPLAIALLAGAVTLAAGTSFAADTCTAPCAPKFKEAKVARSVSANVIAMPPLGTPLLAATLKKGKKKRILIVEAMLTTGGFGNPVPDLYHLDLDVNGFFVSEPTLLNPLGYVEDCGLTVAVPDAECTVSAQWFVDVAAADAATGPGTFLNVPLTATLYGGSVVGAANPVDVEMTMRLEKK